MREGIHPTYREITVKCSCGNSFETRSTYKAEQLGVEICSACHPFYQDDGSQRIVDTMGRVEKFKERFSRYSKKGSTQNKPAEDAQN